MERDQGTSRRSDEAMPLVRGLDLSFPVMPFEQQRQLAQHAQTTQRITSAADAVAEAADALRQALADAVGSGVACNTETESRHHPDG